MARRFQNMKEVLEKMVKGMEKVLSTSASEISMKENGKMIYLMVREHLIILG